MNRTEATTFVAEQLAKHDDVTAWTLWAPVGETDRFIVAEFANGLALSVTVEILAEP